MNKKRTAFLILTALFSVGMLFSGVMNIAQPKIVSDMAVTLGVPAHIMTLVGIWKLLGVPALWIKKFPKLMEYAYAGFFFDLTGAAFLHVAAGDLAGAPAPLVYVAILSASYYLRGALSDDAGETARLQVAA